MFNSADGESEWSTAFADMPMEVTSDPAQFQAFLSDLSIDSGLGSFLETTDVDGWLYGDQIPIIHGANTTLTAFMLDVPFPGFSDKYGKDSIVDVFGNLTAANGWTSSAAS